VHCPDCGRERVREINFCPECGFPFAELEARLAQEKEETTGWAEKILGKPAEELPTQDSDTITSFLTGVERLKPSRLEEDKFKCERCLTPVNLGTLCPTCGEKLPTVMETDPYLLLVFKSIWRMIFAPRRFSLDFPYPLVGGTMQPYLYPGVFASLFVLTLPFTRVDLWIEELDPTPFILPFIVGFLIAIFAVPALMYISVWMIDTAGRALGGRGIRRRVARTLGAYVIFVTLLGTIGNLGLLALYIGKTKEIRTPQTTLSFHNLFTFARNAERVTLGIILALLFWNFTWAVGSLYRLSWWKAIILALSVLSLLLALWVYFLIFLPVYEGGLL